MYMELYGLEPFTNANRALLLKEATGCIGPGPPGCKSRTSKPGKPKRPWENPLETMGFTMFYYHKYRERAHGSKCLGHPILRNVDVQTHLLLLCTVAL